VDTQQENSDKKRRWVITDNIKVQKMREKTELEREECTEASVKIGFLKERSKAYGAWI
jgi:hypothetical protein